MRLALLSLALLLAACSSSSDDQIDPPDSGPAPDTGEQAGIVYFRDVKPILDGRCVACHQTGGIGPIDLAVPAVAVEAAARIKAQVESGLMPPWHAGEGCNTFTNDRSLTEEQRTTLMEWVDSGASMGDPAIVGDPLPPLEVGLTRTDLRVMTAGAYQPSGQDDYRCFVVEWPETTQKFINGFNLEPSNPAIVHHANLYIATGQGAADFRASDAAAAGPGYPCFGGAFAAGTALLGSWAPGSTGIVYPAGTGIRIDPGAVIVMEMHFNVGAGREGEDRSSLALQMTDTVEREAVIAPFWNFQAWSQNRMMDIPSGMSDVMHSFQLNPDGLIQIFAPWLTARRLQIHGAGLHMHYLGTRGTIRVIRPDATEQCVLEIPRWDFNWQYGYLLSETIPFELGLDQLYLECHWDNTPGNQPIIDGVRREARDVNWGSGSGDEMCIGYLYITAE
jgi:mono/diheme cytochrome c family protein